LLTPADVDRTARLLASAFDDDPAYAYLFPDAAARPLGLRDFFRRNLATHLPFGCTFVEKDQGELLATVTLRPPEGVKVSALTMIRRGLVPFAIDHGAGAVRRLLALKRAYDDLERAASRSRPHWHVHMMVVAPALQGRGVGSKLLAAALDRAIGARAREGHEVVLTTHKPRNVAFYRRLGFETIDERDITVDPQATRYRVWSMTRRTGV
jgi:ribosomal protein S18 acetylase RimI-like enzyme